MPRGGKRANAGRPTTVDTESRREAFRKYVPEAKLKEIIQAQTAKAISDGDTNAAKLVLDGLFGPDVQRAEILLGELTDGDLVAEAKRRIRDRAAAGELPAPSTD